MIWFFDKKSKIKPFGFGWIIVILYFTVDLLIQWRIQHVSQIQKLIKHSEKAQNSPTLETIKQLIKL